MPNAIVQGWDQDVRSIAGPVAVNRMFPVQENTMAMYNIEVPERNSIDSLAEQREQRDARVRANMSKKSYLDAILARIREEMEDTRTPLGDVVDRLFSAPLRDSYDYRSFLAMHDGHRIGAEVLCAVCDCSLAEYEDADNVGF